MATTKQKVAVRKISENLRKTKPDPVGKVLIESGYSKSVSEAPSQVLRSKGFKELLEEAGATDALLAKVLTEGLEATKAVVMGKESTDSFVDVQPDFMVRHKYLETGLKIKGHLKETPLINNGIIAILGKYGLDDVGQAQATESGLSQDSSRP